MDWCRIERIVLQCAVDVRRLMVGVEGMELDVRGLLEGMGGMRAAGSGGVEGVSGF